MEGAASTRTPTCLLPSNLFHVHVCRTLPSSFSFLSSFSFPPSLTRLQVAFINNSCTTSGAGLYALEDCQVQFNGNISFVGNVAQQTGGAIAVSGGRVIVNGPIHAHNNSAAGKQGGGFAYVEPYGLQQTPGMLQFADSAAQGSCISDNGPHSISLSDGYSENSVHLVCGSNTTAPSWQPGVYNVTGAVCACNSAFVSGASTSCSTSCTSTTSQDDTARVYGECASKGPSALAGSSAAFACQDSSRVGTP